MIMAEIVGQNISFSSSLEGPLHKISDGSLIKLASL